MIPAANTAENHNGQGDFTKSEADTGPIKSSAELLCGSALISAFSTNAIPFLRSFAEGKWHDGASLSFAIVYCQRLH